MDALKLTEEQKKLIEEYGRFMERHGNTPAAARIMGLMTVADEVELTFDEIRESLHLSKSATSIALNTLISGEKVDYTTKYGDRKRYFKTKVLTWKETFKKEMSKHRNFADLLERIRQSRTDATPEFNAKLEELVSFLRYVGDQFPKLYDQWEESKK